MDVNEVRVGYNYRRPNAYFSTPQVPGLCSRHPNVRRAYMAVGHQLRALLGGEWQPKEMFSDDRPWPVGDQVVWVRRA
jgi:hypothetical protein